MQPNEICSISSYVKTVTAFGQIVFKMQIHRYLLIFVCKFKLTVRAAFYTLHIDHNPQSTCFYSPFKNVKELDYLPFFIHLPPAKLFQFWRLFYTKLQCSSFNETTEDSAICIPAMSLETLTIPLSISFLIKNH